MSAHERSPRRKFEEIGTRDARDGLTGIGAGLTRPGLLVAHRRWALTSPTARDESGFEHRAELQESYGSIRDPGEKCGLIDRFDL